MYVKNDPLIFFLVRNPPLWCSTSKKSVTELQHNCLPGYLELNFDSFKLFIFLSNELSVFESKPVYCTIKEKSAVRLKFSWNEEKNMSSMKLPCIWSNKHIFHWIKNCHCNNKTHKNLIGGQDIVFLERRIYLPWLNPSGPGY